MSIFHPKKDYRDLNLTGWSDNLLEDIWRDHLVKKRHSEHVMKNIERERLSRKVLLGPQAWYEYPIFWREKLRFELELKIEKLRKRFE